MTATATATEAPAVREPSEYERFRHYLTTDQMLAQIAPLVGGEAQAKMFVRVTLNAIQKTPELLDADRKSLLLACMQAARDKLMPDGKEAVLNIYNTKHKIGGREVWMPTVQYLPMVAGLIKTLYASGEVTLVDGVAVYAADLFDYARGDSPYIHHKPNMTAEPGEIIAAYVVVKLKSGEKKLEVIPRRDIDKIREASKAPNSPAWAKWLDQMAIKAVIKRVYKQIPSSVEVDQVIAADNDALGFDDFAMSGAEFNKPASAVDKINAEVKGSAKPNGGEPAAITHNPGEKVPPPRVEDESVPTPAEVAAAVALAGASTAFGKPIDDLEPVMSFEAVHTKIESAKTIDALAEARDLIRSVKDPAHRTLLAQDATKREAALRADDGK